ncbi:MAG: hypothetical protein ACKV2O_22650 [Acidimicrobiales bacterium]
MEILQRVFACERCGHEFEPKPLGRRPLYCGRTCRQRAYEARCRAAFHHRLLAPTLTPALPPEIIPRQPPPPPRYESGRHRHLTHALRPDGPANANGERPTICGTYAVPKLSRWQFGDPRDHHRPQCRTCQAVARRYPPVRVIDPPADLSHIKHILAGGLNGFAIGDHHRQTTTLLYLYRLTHLPPPSIAHAVA